MTSDPETGCTCNDETTRPCPVHPVKTATPAPARLNSMLPQATEEVIDAILRQVAAESDPALLSKIFDERLDLFRRENFALYHRLLQCTSPDQLGWVIFVYRVLAEQNQRDIQRPA